MSIELKGLTFRYPTADGGDGTAVDHVTLTIPEGEWVCIVGHTGSGKSTLVRHFNGLNRPTEGSITVDNITVTSENHQNLRPLRRLVGLVFQYPEQQLFEETVAKEIAFGPKNWGVPSEQLDQCVNDAMDAVGLDQSYADRNPFALSGGQKRRVAIASVLASQPKYLVLDEPTAGLDAQGCHSLLQLLSQIRSQGVTLIQVTHDLELAFRYATKILALKKGQVAVYDSPQNAALQLASHPVEGLVLPPLVRFGLGLRARGMKDAPLTGDPQKLAEWLGDRS